MQEKDKPFPRYARDYFEQLLEQYMLLLNEQNAQPPAAIAAIIAKAKANPDDVNWADVFALETAYLYAVPDDRLEAELRLARDRYQSIVGNDAYADYLKSAPALPAPDDAKYNAKARAELLTLAERMRYIYTFVPPKEDKRNTLAMHAAIWTCAAAAVGLVIYWVLLLGWGITVATIVVVMFVGQMGGFISVQQRLQASAGVDPLFKELQLSNGWFSIVVIAPLTGAIFA
ncbi:MAG: hypothetical protein QOJ39_3340, partial [Candidatus Eremiobacteraeota bacterium]|nr:hypothetical protein [Candidatus Eremiobacteraeota bacterium]